MTLLEKHLPLVQKIAWSFVKNYPALDFDDVMSQACLLCLEAEPKYDPSRARETTFIWTVVTNGLRSYVRRETRLLSAVASQPTGIQIDYCTPEERAIAEEEWQCILAGLSPDAQLVCGMILESRFPYLPTHKPHRCQARIRKLLRWHGWDNKRISRCMREIKVALQHV